MGAILILATVNLSLGGLGFLLGLLILRENPRQRLNRVVALMLFFAGFGSMLAALGFLGGSRTQPTGIAAVNPIESLAYLWEFYFPTLFLFASLFPHERAYTRTPRRLKRVPWPGIEVLVYTPHAAHFLVLLGVAMFHPQATALSRASVGLLATFTSLGTLLLDLFLAVHQALFSLVNLAYGIGAVLLLVDSWSRTRVPRVRSQLRALTLGLSAGLLLYSMGSLVPSLFGLKLPETWRSALTAGALLIGSGSLAYAIVRYKFLDARLLARRGILYGVATAMVIGVYLLIVGEVNRLVTGISGIDRRVLEPLFLIVALILFQPLLARLEDMLDRMFLRDASDYRNVLRNLGRDLLGTLELEPLLDRSIRTIVDSLLLRCGCVAAFARGRTLVHGTNEPRLGADELVRLRHAIIALPAEEGTFRMTEPVEGLDDVERAWLTERLGVALVVALRSRGETVGALLLGAKVTGTEYTSEDVQLLSTLAGQMGVSLQNALLVREREETARFEEELRLARQIQRSFLQTEFPRLPRFEVHATTLPSKEVGGDLYDLVPCGDGAFMVAIADVAGKGVPAALLSGMLQASLRTQAASIGSVAEITRNINTLVYRGGRVDQFATFFLARVDSHSMRVSFTNAGHNYPVVVRRAGGAHDLLECGGTVLGILEKPVYDEGDLTLHSGDHVVLYTDGITEAQSADGSMYGEERLYALLGALPLDCSARDVAGLILEDVRGWLGGLEARDDITLMVLRVLEPERETLDEVGVGVEPNAVAEV
ncbi:MAG: PP2C family protein-serine/threonine phosphatase [Candidatus Eisenbacteria bacterium]